MPRSGEVKLRSNQEDMLRLAAKHGTPGTAVSFATRSPRPCRFGLSSALNVPAMRPGSHHEIVARP
jgi:hypothetical protein